jgi:transcription termination factor Rho
MELELDRDLLERRIFPAINIQKSGTRKDDLLYHPDEFKRIGMIRRQLAQLPGGEAMEKLIHNIENTKSNAELLLSGLK